MTLLFCLLGLLAGTITTIAGQGGGLFLLLASSAILGPHAALAITTPALLLGNSHRSFLLRKFVDRGVALRMLLGALPGGVIGGALAGVISPLTLKVILIAMAGLSILKAVGVLKVGVSRHALVPAGFVIGLLTGTGGGAGVLFAPVLLSFGLRGRAFIGTSAVVAVATHIGRLAGYASIGLFHKELIGPTIAVSVAIFAGNAVGDRLRNALTARTGGERTTTVLEYGMLVVCVVLSVAGLG